MKKHWRLIWDCPYCYGQARAAANDEATYHDRIRAHMREYHPREQVPPEVALPEDDARYAEESERRARAAAAEARREEQRETERQARLAKARAYRKEHPRQSSQLLQSDRRDIDRMIDLDKMPVEKAVKIVRKFYSQPDPAGRAPSAAKAEKAERYVRYQYDRRAQSIALYGRRNPKRDGTPTKREREKAEHIAEAKRRVAARGPSKARPGHASVTDPEKWTRAVMAVARSRKKPESQFTKQDWGLATTIYGRMEGAKIKLTRMRKYCLLFAKQKPTASVCEKTGAFFRTKPEVVDAAAYLPPGKYKAHVVYVDEHDGSVGEVTKEHFVINVRK